MKTNRVVVVAMLLGAGIQVGFAEDAQSVLSDLHKSNQMEIRMGELAKEKGQSADVRSFGGRLVKDHGEADEKVKTLADKQGIVLEPTGKLMKAIHNHDIEQLSKKSGKDFDKEFADAMVKDHQKDIAKLEKAQQSLGGTPTGELIGKLLPTLHEHLDAAEKLSSQS